MGHRPRCRRVPTTAQPFRAFPCHERTLFRARLDLIVQGTILRALHESNWVLGGPRGAAIRLGLKRTTLQARIQKLGIARSTA